MSNKQSESFECVQYEYLFSLGLKHKYHMRIYAVWKWKFDMHWPSLKDKRNLLKHFHGCLDRCYSDIMIAVWNIISLIGLLTPCLVVTPRYCWSCGWHDTSISSYQAIKLWRSSINNGSWLRTINSIETNRIIWCVLLYCTIWIQLFKLIVIII